MPRQPSLRTFLTTLLGCFAILAGGFPVICRADRPISKGAPVYQEPVNAGYPPLPEGAVLVESSASGGNGIDAARLLLAEIERAREGLNVEQLPNLENAEADVLRKMSDVESYLQRETGADNFAAWMRYLKLDPLRDAIDQSDSVATRGRASLELESRLRGVEVGLELSSLVKLRQSVQRYIAALRYSDPERGIASVERQLDGLVKLLSTESPSDEQEPVKESSSDKDAEDAGQPASLQPRPLSELSAEDVAQMDLIIGGLSDANQASDLVAKIRAHYSQPNLRGWVDGRAVTDAVSRPINTPADVNDCILGTRVIGNSRVDGTLRGELMPSQGHVLLLLRMDGLFTTSARGFRKPITLDTTGSGGVYAARQLAITEIGTVLGETIATADLTTQIQRINHPLRLVRHIAAQKAAEQRPQAEAISREKLRQRVLQQFDEQTATAASRQFPSLDASIDPWLRRLDLPDLIRSIGSTTDNVYAIANLQRPAGLAASLPPPPLATVLTAQGNGVAPGRYLAAVQVHQSLLDNTIAPLLAGETFTPDKIDQLATALGLELPPRPRSTNQAQSSEAATQEPQNDDEESLELEESPAPEDEPGQENFEVDLESFRPVFIEADNQELRIGMRGTRFSQDDRELKRTLQVSATYRPVSGGDGTMWLLRDEEVQLSFPGTRRLSVSQTAIKTNMERSFNELFPKELLRRSFPLPPTLKMPALTGKVLQVSGIDLTDGWITVVVR